MTIFATFWGCIELPDNFKPEHAQSAAYIAWKGGVYVDKLTAEGRRAVRRWIKRWPDLFSEHVFDIYPVNEFRFAGRFWNSTHDLPAGSVARDV